VLVAADDVVDQRVDVRAVVGALLLTELLLLDLGRREEHAPSSVGDGSWAIVARRFEMRQVASWDHPMELIERGARGVARGPRRSTRAHPAGPTRRELDVLAKLGRRLAL
jgi:hypothetical protein